uniref:Alpha-1,3-glucosyltransferase n=1 Tax=Plectus sambesii TaxID=2011161 RepID=A0A914WRZ4_9BILA
MNERSDVRTPSLLTVLCGVFALKLALFPCYHSTDFEVHRNWLALTSQLPLSQWYFENTSIWTLDYPPFFAWFEKGIAQSAPLVDKGMLTIQAEPYFNHRTLNFHRLTVVIADLLFVLATFRLLKVLDRQEPKLSENRGRLRRFVLGILLLANVGLILVDNIHFQYNSFLTAFLLLSIGDVIDGKLLWGGFWYCVLVNFKHIYLYLAPAYAAYYLRHYIFQAEKSKPNDHWIRSFS